MTSSRWRVTLKGGKVVATCALLLMVSAILIAQNVDPRGVPPPRRNTPEYPERDYSRKVRRIDNAAPGKRLILLQIKKDFEQIQVLNDELGQQLTSNRPLDYKHISDAASKIKSLAGRLDSNLVLGKPESKEPRPEFQFSETVLRSSLLSLHGLVISFVESPIFRETGVFDINETRKAKHDVDSIIVVSDQIKTIAKRLRKDANR